MESFLTFPWSSCSCLHFDKKDLVVINAESKEVEESIWQALNDVLPVHAEEFSCIGSKYLASRLAQGHHGEFLNVGFSHD